MISRQLERIEMPRMVAERLEPAHLAELSALLRDRRVARTLMPGGEPPSEAEVLAGLDDKIRHWENHGFGLWLLRDRRHGAMVGRGGLQHTWATGHDEVEVAWTIAPERWGQGLATELGRASIDVAFCVLELPDVIAYTSPSNVASRRVMEKTGFGLEREFESEGELQILYRRSAA